MTKKKVIAIVVTTLALTAGSIGVAGAASKGAQKASKHVSVTKDETRQSRPTDCWPDPMGADRGDRPDRAAIETLVSTTIGVDTATIKSRLQAGESLAQIAGAKKDALIAALVADETKRIDAAVTAGTLTAAQATEMKANLVAHVTEEINAVGGKGRFGKGPKGPKGDRDGRGGHGHDHRGPKGGGMGGATAPTLPTPTATAGA
jgi:hypothetical protein